MRSLRLSRRRLIAGAAVVVAAIAALDLADYRFSRESYWPQAVAAPHERYDLPLVVAHQVNTLEAMRRVLDSEIGGLELDVQLSRDGVATVYHDDRLEESTGCEGRVAERDWEALAGCRYKSGERLVSLDQALTLVRGRKRLFIDAKSFRPFDGALARGIARELARHDAFRETIVESFNPIFLLQLRRADRRARLMFDFADESKAVGSESAAQLAQIPWLLKQEWFRWLARELVRPDYLGPRFSVEERTVRRLAALGYPMIAWTVDDPARAARLLAAGVSGVQSNRPLELARALAKAAPPRLDDASRLNAVAVAAVVRVMEIEDVRRAFSRARTEGLKVSIAGRRHSMGAQSFGPGHLVLDMTAMRRVSYDPASKLVTAQAGATWMELQALLDARGRSVKVMQSDNIFTIGGSLSVNAHGWQARSGPVASTVEDLTIVLPSGESRRCSRAENRELFGAALGGYGAFGVIVEARLRTAVNAMYRKSTWHGRTEGLAARLKEKVLDNPRAELAYARLSVDARHFLTEASINVYEPLKDQPRVLPAMSHDSLARLKRGIFRASERSESGKSRRWLLERHLGGALESRPVSRNTVMGPDIHVLWPEDARRRDILHEYFVPLAGLERFLAGLREPARRHRQNLLNVTIRELRRDEDSLLRYAPEDRIAAVLFFSQAPGAEAERAMAALTSELIDLADSLGGSFYLPYRLHYTREQFRRAYPSWREFSRLRLKYDPERLIGSGFLSHIEGS